MTSGSDSPEEEQDLGPHEEHESRRRDAARLLDARLRRLLRQPAVALPLRGRVGQEPAGAHAHHGAGRAKRQHAPAAVPGRRHRRQRAALHAGRAGVPPLAQPRVLGAGQVSARGEEARGGAGSGGRHAEEGSLEGARGCGGGGDQVVELLATRIPRGGCAGGARPQQEEPGAALEELHDAAEARQEAATAHAVRGGGDSGASVMSPVARCVDPVRRQPGSAHCSLLLQVEAGQSELLAIWTAAQPSWLHCNVSMNVMKQLTVLLLSAYSTSELAIHAFTLAADDWSCFPAQVSITDAKDAFYRRLAALQSEAPRFEGHHDYLCAQNYEATWENCLPISARMDEDECAGADRLDLLMTTRRPCQAGVLHMLLVDVYAELHRAGAEPALVFGTMLGAVREGGIIPFTEDADLGHQVQDDPMPIVRRRLQERGYHVFMDTIWRVCVAPTHPLAARLYDPMLAAPIEPCTGPYLDLYRIEPDPELAGHWNIEHSRRRNNSIPVDKLLPYSKVKLNGVEYDTVANPVDFLIEEYGASCMRPTKNERDKWSGEYIDDLLT
ncbi:unnamed protein product [Phytophthora fragariaefolia]|uniref:Unnamed protein product n=1 Tax=Phytophthora fragariaefolia TaxID=1490495 RepID=A0A9W6X3E6_9STRA|nr:unnamed protein product [Phytophthora fragariaefolia]